VVVHTDSQYAIGVLSKGWKAKANTELIRVIRALLAARKGQARLRARPRRVPLNESAPTRSRGSRFKPPNEPQSGVSRP
jgi:ribonuclease HI